MKDKELEEQINEIVLLPGAWAFDDYEESKKQLLALIAQERRKAKIEVYEELKPPKEFEQFSRLTGGNPCTICGFDPIALIGHIDNRIAGLKEDKEA